MGCMDLSVTAHPEERATVGNPFTEDPVASGTERTIRHALMRLPRFDETSVTVTVVGTTVLLFGTVETEHDRKRAEDAAWCPPLVAAVHNNIRVRPHGIQEP